MSFSYIVILDVLMFFAHLVNFKVEKNEDEKRPEDVEDHVHPENVDADVIRVCT